MDTFVARYHSAITAVLSGFDRLVFRGSLRGLVRKGGMQAFLNSAGVRLLDFKDYVLTTSERVKEASLRAATEQQRPIRYLESARTDKEALARQLLHEHPIDQGLTCAFRTVEPWMSFEYQRSADPRARGLRLRPRKCRHIYQYFLHPVFGFMSARLQTWFPFNIQICLNGREWAARQLARRGHHDFTRADNCCTHLGDPALAQRLLAQQLRTNWSRGLDPIARTLNPLHPRIFRIFRHWPHPYYWSAYQTEWATDLLFAAPAALAALYPHLVRHALLHAITHGDFALAGFRNRDLRRLLSPAKRPLTTAQARRLAARISRQLRLLRAHGLIRKLGKTHRYQLTPRGNLLCGALFATRNATIQKLVGSAAA